MAMESGELSTAEAAKYLRAKGYPATPGKLREYEWRGLMGDGVSRHTNKRRCYKLADLQRLMLIMDLMAPGLSMARIKELEKNMSNLKTMKTRLAQGQLLDTEVSTLQEMVDLARECLDTLLERERGVKGSRAYLQDLLAIVRPTEDMLLRRKAMAKRRAAE